MALQVLDADGDIVIILQSPNNQNFGAKAIPLSRPKKKPKRRRAPIVFLDDPDPGDAAEVATEAIDLPLADIRSLFQLPVSSTSQNAESADASAPSDGPTHHEVQYKVSSKHLRLASPIFEGILSGKYPERSLREKIVGEGGSECRLLRTSDWDAEAFLMLMNCIHVRHRKLPKKVDLLKLTQFAVLVDYYNCHESTALLGGNWIKELQDNLPTVHGQPSMMWMFVSWVFTDAEIFAKMTELALKASKRRVEIPDLPFPAALIGMLGPYLILALAKYDLTFIDDIENGKHKLLAEINGTVAKHYCKLRKRETDCTHQAACSAMLLGALLQAVTDARDTSRSYSPEEARSAVLGFLTPSWREAGSYNSHHLCTLQKLLEPEMDMIWESLQGLKVDKYPFHEPYLANAHASQKGECD